MDLEQRLVDIEVKLMRQEDLTQQLSDLVYAQQRELDELRALCKALAERITDSGGGGSDPYSIEPPPHY